MSLDIPNLKNGGAIKDFDQRLRDEANEDLADIVHAESLHPKLRSSRFMERVELVNHSRLPTCPI